MNTLDTEYRIWLTQLKSKISSVQIKAAISVMLSSTIPSFPSPWGEGQGEGIRE